MTKMRFRTLFFVCLALAHRTGAAQEVTLLPTAHAHNDYAHARPLQDALANGFGSVEADIFLTPDGLSVGHERRDLKPGRTLEKLYLQPLRERVQQNGGRVYPGGPTFYLLIDVKTGAQETYAVLDRMLAKYADILSVTRHGQPEPGAVTVVLSGNRAIDTIERQEVRYVGIDGRPGDLDSAAPTHLLPWISTSWHSMFAWRGNGPMPAAERAKLTEFVDQAHRRSRQVRFWATPENRAVWRELTAAKVDWLNTDQLAELRAFLLTPDERPNVVLIVVDDFGWADLGCYGSKFHESPQIDALAASGVRFTDAYAACPVCSPTRAAILTGRYPARLHLTDWLPGRRDMPSQRLLRPDFEQQLALEEVTLAEHFSQAGYACAQIGKWHLGGEGFEPTRQGFSHHIGGDAAGTPLSYFAPYRRGDRVMPGLADAPAGEYLTDRLTAESERFIEQHRDRPFFLYLPHFTVHTPLQAKQDLIAKYQKKLGREWKPTGQQNNPIYAAMMDSLDSGVGRIVAKLKELNLSERTIIVFTSDNGGLATVEGPSTPATSNAPLREGKGYLYEGGIRVPLIVSWPKQLAGGQTCAVPTSSIDLAPTLLELCGLPGNSGAASSRPFDGISLASVLRAPNQADALPTRSLFWHYPHYSNQGGRPGGAIRSGNLKLVEFYETERRELFDLQKDMRESNNLAEQLPEAVTRLAQELHAWRELVGAQSMAANPDFVPNPQAADGTITLPGRTADLHGTMVRFEPQPHKNTLGFWVRADDWVHWDFQVSRPGEFEVAIRFGCGNGSGGSEVEFRIGEQVLTTTVTETGGFQNFVNKVLGTVKLEQEGRYQLTVKPRSKPGVAVMDLQQVTLRVR